MNPQTHTPSNELGEALHGRGGGPAGPGEWRSNGDDRGDHDRSRLATAKTGLWLFLATATVVFSMLLSAYLGRMDRPDWHLLPRLWILWLNTFFLILGSGTLEWARRSAHRDLREARFWLLTAGAFTLFFVIGQLIAWQELSLAGYVLASNPSSSFFYLLTALHGLHVLGGLLAWGWATVQLLSGKGTERGVRSKIELCAIYWHFLLLVWLTLFGFFWFTQ